TIGGHTISNDKIDISLSNISKIHHKAVFLKGLKNGHLLAYTGKLGRSLKRLAILQNRGTLKTNHVFIKPTLRANFFYEIAPLISCAMDISDGLSKDLSRLLALNKCGISWFKKLDDYALYSGEEYEILFAFDEKERQNIETIAKKHGV
ncbi:thiamine-phosphate kinase, partial [Campylobacter jejuni]